MYRFACILIFSSIGVRTLGSQTPASNQGEDARDRVYYPGDTEKLAPLGRKLAANIWLDQKQIWSSPFRMKKSDAKWWITFGGATAALIATDKRTYDVFENSKGQILWGNRISNIGSVYTVIPVTAGFYGAGVLVHNAKARETGVLSTEALLDSLIVSEVTKTIAGRNRPDSVKRGGDFFQGGSSFPSGHAISAWTVASVVAHEYSDTKWVPFVAYGLASTVSCARFAAQRHFASDIVAGGAMGWFIGRFVYKTHEDHALHKHAWATPVITPVFQTATGTYGIGLTFVPGG
ncbi:MAG: phosphatase PAP2 family protein [Acidobacteriaceae bacterium]|nr:phosphatase PAP2 family protein [Acidobacteriaceae bacterium]